MEEGEAVKKVKNINECVKKGRFWRWEMEKGSICGRESDSIEGLRRVKCFECFELSL